ncbi:MAG TPA: phosphopantetheine-binding protein [Myxococcota bacterium]|nr:phosphopantetheine-binding protein [Myxococcota bacterium]
MNDTEIFEAIRGVLEQHLHLRIPVTPQTDIARDLALDSVHQLTFIVELENRFRICFDPDDEQGLRTLGDVARLVARRLQVQAEVGTTAAPQEGPAP